MSGSLTGQRLGNYDLGRLLGSGGMGEVYEATAGDERFALKIMHAETAADKRYVERFLREVELMQAMRHPHIMPVLDFGWQRQRLFLLMPFVEGFTLDRVMKKKYFSPLASWRVLDPLTQALAHAHLQGIIHRDVKPGNALIQRGDHHLYLLDFGLGKRPGLDSLLTEPGTVLGTPHYMPPEAVVGEELDERSDIYSLGIILYQLLLNQLPFDHEDTQLTMFAHVYQPVPDPIDVDPNFPQALQEVTTRCLQKAQQDRYGSIREFVQAYLDALDSLSETEANALYGVRS